MQDLIPDQYAHPCRRGRLAADILDPLPPAPRPSPRARTRPVRRPRVPRSRPDRATRAPGFGEGVGKGGRRGGGPNTGVTPRAILKSRAIRGEWPRRRRAALLEGFFGKLPIWRFSFLFHWPRRPDQWGGRMLVYSWLVVRGRF